MSAGLLVPPAAACRARGCAASLRTSSWQHPSAEPPRRTRRTGAPSSSRPSSARCAARSRRSLRTRRRGKASQRHLLAAHEGGRSAATKC
eukprot:2363214-Prymnesium_polylepis.1